MLPLSLLKAAENHPMLIELKNGDTYNGLLVSCNMFMNICLKEVICTSRDGDRFWKLPEVYIRGNSIKYLRIPDEVVDLVPEVDERESKQQFRQGRAMAGRGRNGRGEDGGRGRGRGDSGRGGRGGRGREGGREGRGEGRGFRGGRDNTGRGRGRT